VPLLAADLDPALVIGDDAVNDGKSEASTLADIFRREEGLENPILCFGIHAAAGIGNPEAKEITPAVRTLRRPRYANGDRSHIADDGLTSVGGQIDNDLLKLTDIGKQFAELGTDDRKRLFQRQLLSYVPLAAHIRDVLQGRANHTAPKSRFFDELEDYMAEEAAEQTLRTIVSWGRYAELFAYDDNRQVFSLENPT